MNQTMLSISTQPNLRLERGWNDPLNLLF